MSRNKLLASNTRLLIPTKEFALVLERTNETIAQYLRCVFFIYIRREQNIWGLLGADSAIDALGIRHRLIAPHRFSQTGACPGLMPLYPKPHCFSLAELIKFKAPFPAYLIEQSGCWSGPVTQIGSISSL